MLSTTSNIKSRLIRELRRETLRRMCHAGSAGMGIGPSLACQCVRVHTSDASDS